MAKYRKKPVVIEAVQLTWENWDEVCDLAGVGKLTDGKPEGCYLDDDSNVIQDSNGKLGITIPTLEGVMIGTEGDWIIKGVEGEIYPCKPNVFEATYELVEDGEGD